MALTNRGKQQARGSSGGLKGSVSATASLGPPPLLACAALAGRLARKELRSPRSVTRLPDDFGAVKV